MCPALNFVVILFSSYVILPFMCNLSLLAVLGYGVEHNKFSPSPSHYIDIVPVPKKFIPAIPVDEGIKRLDTIF